MIMMCAKRLKTTQVKNPSDVFDDSLNDKIVSVKRQRFYIVDAGNLGRKVA